MKARRKPLHIGLLAGETHFVRHFLQERCRFLLPAGTMLVKPLHRPRLTPDSGWQRMKA
jgi:hypothetical protein